MAKRVGKKKVLLQFRFYPYVSVLVVFFFSFQDFQPQTESQLQERFFNDSLSEKGDHMVRAEQVKRQKKGKHSHCKMRTNCLILHYTSDI